MYIKDMKFLSKKKIIFIILILLIILSGYFLNLKNNYQKVRSPIESFLWKQSLNKEKSCDFQKSKYLYSVTELEKTKKENDILRQALGLELNKEYDLILANINSKNSFEEIITINKGTKDGIEKNMIVLTGERALVGRILNTYEDFSEVMLISDIDSIIDVRVLGKDEIAIVNGDGDNLIFDFVSKDSNIQKGDIFVTSGISSDFKEGLLVGEITEIKNLASEAEEQGQAIPFFKLRDLSSVFIISNVK